MGDRTNGHAKRPSTSRAWSSIKPALSPWILDAVAAMGFNRMTNVQAATLPKFMANNDVLVEAVTGSGKTLAFLIPIVERILTADHPTKRHHVASIIIAPTRELAIQIEKVLVSLISFHTPSGAARRAREENEAALSEEEDIDFSTRPRILPQLLVSGVVSPTEDLQLFLEHSPNVLVATPGRLLELLSSPRVHCTQSSFEVLVLDEADRLLDLGFKDDLTRILARLPKQRRTGLFSASASEALDQLFRVGLRNAVRIAVKVQGDSGKHDQRTPTSLQMTYVVTKASQKLPTLLKILTNLQPPPLKTIVYFSSCVVVDYFRHILTSILADAAVQYSLITLHGKQDAKVRQKNFMRFSDPTTRSVLITTDVAARGLDIPQVDLVVQVDPPADPKVFLHRCGRAGRAGRKGLAVVFLRPGHEEDYVPFLKVRQTPVTPFEQANIDLEPEECAAFSAKIREIVLKDRALYEQAMRAFPSWVNDYRRHQARHIFQLADLDWQDLANAWGLLKMPRMPELRGWDGDVSLGLSIDFDSYQFRDKRREEDRQASNQKKLEVGDAPDIAQKSDAAKRAWSDALDQKNGREKRREKNKRKKEWLRRERMTSEEREKQADLEGLIEKAKRQRVQEDVEFEGFSD